MSSNVQWGSLHTFSGSRGGHFGEFRNLRTGCVCELIEK